MIESPADLFRRRFDGTRSALTSLERQVDDLVEIATTIAASLENGGTLFTAGNGGSAAQALHLAEELVGRYRTDRPPLAAVCLNADPTALTCIANDFGYEQVFARPIEALGRTGDVLCVLTTSGRSANLVKALDVARATGVTTIGLLGGDGGDCAALCDRAIVIEGGDSAHIQEAHLVALHLVCEAMETA